MSDVWLLLHIFVAFWFVAGLAGRTVTIAQARRETSIERVETLMTAAGRFEQKMVIPGSAGVLVLGLITMVAQGRSLVGDDNWWLLTSLVLYLVLAVLVPTVFLPRGKVYERAFQEAKTAGAVTPALTDALADPVVAMARRVEIGVVGLIIVLMVLKPF